MLPVLSSEQMQSADRTTIEDLGVPGMVLMEMAASAVTDVILEHFGEAHRVVVVCGPGNNGGDGLAVARQLRNHYFDAEVVMVADPDTLRGDAARQLVLARNFDVPIHHAPAALAARLREADIVVDGIFGTGLDRAPTGAMAEAIAAINEAMVPVVAIDIPSGLSGSSSQVSGRAVKADLTVTFGAPKYAHALPPACWNCGEVVIGDIGIPPWVIERVADVRMVEAEDVARWLPERPPDAHKGTFGHLVLFAGRLGRVGAAALGARGAVTTGAGLVTVATTADAVTALQALVPEAMVDGLAVGDSGLVAGTGVERVLERASAVAVGPGLGTGDGPRRLVEALLERWQGPLVIDADALNVLAGRLDGIANRGGVTVLTPHPAELGRLLARSTEAVVADRLGAARAAARASRAVLLAKGARTLVVRPDGGAAINVTGTPGLASGGAGDVLTGIVGALLAQGLAPDQAALAGAYLHGRAAEIGGERFSGALPAAELIHYLPRAELELRELGC